jgi:hypothetical protein
MRIRIAIVLALVAFLLLSGLAMAQTGGPGLTPAYAVRPATSSGGNYHLTNLAWQVSGAAAGGNYTLVVPCASALRGSGCCCAYLPVVLRNVQ